jgi:hypothetical protein
MRDVYNTIDKCIRRMLLITLSESEAESRYSMKTYSPNGGRRVSRMIPMMDGLRANGRESRYVKHLGGPLF